MFNDELLSSVNFKVREGFIYVGNNHTERNYKEMTKKLIKSHTDITIRVYTSKITLTITSTE